MAVRPVRIGSDFAAGVLDFAEALGVPAARLREASGITLADVADPRRLIDLENIGALMREAGRELGDDAFGIHFGAALELDAMGPFAYAVLNAPTVAVGLGNLSRYLGAIVPGTQSVFEVQGDAASLVVTLGAVEPNAVRHLSEAGALVLLNLIRRLAGEGWHAREVCFRHAEPASTEAHASFGAARVLFGQAVDAIRFDARDLSREVSGADRQLLPIAEWQLEDVLSERTSPDPWLSEVEILIGKQICDGHPNIHALAPQLGLSVRTLQRRLRERDVVYRDLVAGVRRRLARRYLEETRTDLEEIAFLLGYSELSAFDRAFRRWLGRSPSEHRRLARG